MTKADLTEQISERTGIDKTQVVYIIETFMKTVKNSLIEGEPVYLRGFGTFNLCLRKQKKGRNIKQNTSIVIPEHYIPKFKPVKSWMDEVKSKDI